MTPGWRHFADVGVAANDLVEVSRVELGPSCVSHERIAVDLPGFERMFYM
jgi:hypothetical protein